MWLKEGAAAVLVLFLEALARWQLRARGTAEEVMAAPMDTLLEALVACRRRPELQDAKARARSPDTRFGPRGDRGVC